MIECMRPRAAVLLLTGALAGHAFGRPAAPSADVWIVDPTGSGEWTTIQQAVAAAADGDTLLIRSGTYAGFHIQGKGLHLATESGAQVTVSGQVRVSSLASGEQVSISGLTLEHPYTSALLLEDALGPIRLQDCTVRAPVASARVQGCTDVAFTDCALVGVTPFLPGGDALIVSDGSSVALHGCLAEGSAGGDGSDGSNCFPLGCTDGGFGGVGARLEQGSFLYASDCTFIGGAGGEGGTAGGCDCLDGLPGAAILTLTGSSAALLDCDAQGVLQGDVQSLPGAARHLALPPMVEELESVTVTCTGLPGDTVRLRVSLDGAYAYDPARRGVELIGAPLAPDLAGRVGPTSGGPLQFPLSLEGSLGPDGVLDLPLRVLPLDPAVLAVACHLQAEFLDGTGQVTLGNSRVVMALSRRASIVDCPPGECGPLAVVYVDDDAPGDPGPGTTAVSDPLANGTPEHPYDAIQTALDLVAEGGRVIVREGVYRGIGNVDLSFPGHPIHLVGEDGPERCIIDGEDAPVVLLRIEDGAPSTARVEGLAFTRSASTAVRIVNGDPWIHRCVIADNAGPGTPGIDIVGGKSRLTNCVIARNHSTTAGAALRVAGSTAEVRVRSCAIVDNAAPTGAALYTSANKVWIEGSTVAGNSASAQLHVQATSGGTSLRRLYLTSTLCWGNYGSAVYLSGTPARATVAFSDIEGGAAGVGGNGTLEWVVGNLDADPLYVEPPAGDYHIRADSPCVGAGQPGFALEPDERDVDGQPRVAWGVVDIGADEVVDDCDQDGTPDFLEGRRFASPFLSPIGALYPQHHTVPAPPPAVGPVLLELWARADLASPDQRIDVLVNGVPLGSAFVTGASSCPIDLDRATLVIPAERFNLAVAGGDAEFTLLASAQVDPFCDPPFSMVRFAGTYDGDCDQNGVLDACELALDPAADGNANGVLDACE